MKKVITIAFLFFFITTTQAQKKIDADEVTLAELEMKKWPTDSTASAAVLFMKGETFVELLVTRGMTHKVQKKIKIFTKDAFNDWGNEIFRIRNAVVTKLRGATYNLENGKIVKSPLDPNSIFKKQFYKDIDEISITFPNIKEGSVIEYSYTIQYQTAYVPYWNFQRKVPVAWSEFTISVPYHVNLNADVRGDFQPYSHEVKLNGTLQTWAMKDLPAFHEDPFMPDKRTYVSSVNFWICRQKWPELVESLVNSSRGFYNITNGRVFWRKKLDEITAGKTSIVEKMEAVSLFLKENIEWNKVEEIYAYDPDDIMEKKKGSSADINLLLGSLLNSLDIETDFILISTRDNGYVHTEFPTLAQFNYVICRAKVDDNFIYLDATDKFLPYNAVPARCLNRKGLIISKVNSGWVTVTQKMKNRTVIDSHISLSDTGDLVGDLSITNEGYNAGNVRKKISELGKDAYVKNVSQQSIMEIDESTFENVKSLTKPIVEKYKITQKDHVVNNSDLLYVDPFFAFNEEENPFKLQKRLYPLELETAVEKTYLCTFTIPYGYTVETLPENKIMVLPENGAKYVFTATRMQNSIKLLSDLLVNKTYFTPDEYLNLREFYSRMISKQAEQIILKKK